MNQPPVIEVKHLTKEYSLGTVTSLKDSLRHTLARLSGKPTWQRERFKALDDVSFTINQGEVVGIIGHNGAGKSTLLKHLADITRPTSGEVAVRGSIAPLIEVGAGVHPELTGKENIFLNGAILGLSRKEIRRKLDEIIDFSELEQFIDTPVKRYSSGMKVKLGFSIATSMDAEILIIDEVLAVGDLAFQRKCFDRMERLIKNEGKTVLLVSHNIRQVNRMCTRAILLRNGQIEEDGDTGEVCNLFMEENNKKIYATTQANQQKNKSSEVLDILDVVIVGKDGTPTESIDSGDPLRIRVKFHLKREIAKPEIVIGTHTTDFVYLTASTTDLCSEPPEHLSSGEHSIEIIQDSFPFKPGVYGVRMALFDVNRNGLYSGENLAFFSTRQTEVESKQPPMRLLSTQSRWQIR